MAFFSLFAAFLFRRGQSSILFIVHTVTIGTILNKKRCVINNGLTNATCKHSRETINEKEDVMFPPCVVFTGCLSACFLSTFLLETVNQSLSITSHYKQSIAKSRFRLSKVQVLGVFCSSFGTSLPEYPNEVSGQMSLFLKSA